LEQERSKNMAMKQIYFRIWKRSIYTCCSNAS